MCHAQGEGDEWPHRFTVEQVGSAEVHVFDVEGEQSVAVGEAARIDIGCLATIKYFPLRVGANPAIHNEPLCRGVLDIEVDAVRLVGKGTAHAVRGIGRQFKAMPIFCDRVSGIYAGRQHKRQEPVASIHALAGRPSERACPNA